MQWNANARAAISTHPTCTAECFTTGINVWDAENGGKTWPTNVYFILTNNNLFIFSSENLFEILLAK